MVSCNSSLDHQLENPLPFLKEKVTRSLNFFEKIKEVFDPQKRVQRINDLALALIEVLKKTALHTPSEAEKLEEVKLTKLFLKKLNKNDRKCSVISSLEKQLLASRLAIPIEAFSANQEFYHFAKKNFLHHYMREYGHRLLWDQKSFEISFQTGVAESKSWKQVQQEALKLPEKSPTCPSQPWKYGPDGIQNKDMYNWDLLEPYKFEDPSLWNHKYILEVCACHGSSPRKNGDHSWFRLRTPSGAVYSVGLYRPEKNGSFGNLKFPFRVKKGYLMSPDLSEFYPCHITSFQKEISQTIFEQIVAQVESDKMQDQELFQVMGQNCTLYTTKIAKIAGMHLPTEKKLHNLLMPKKIEVFINKVRPFIPECVKKVCRIVTCIFFNFLQYVLGAGAVDASVLSINCQASEKKHMQSFFDVFKPSKASIHHPHTLAVDVCQKIFSWRKCQIEKLKKQGKECLEKLRDINYDVPENYKSSTVFDLV